ncbi:YidB family protein [Zavarzinia compransoris]|uniref:DUF937 domain-containing protein n=1 Tax=Zavarzinia compransoris TaxID=1264899 RepID=A0A317E4P3_9PROT|nr:YidB family protein [Zavarzinia compransoris]PWR22098.1 hypothetical protein DKG75_08980 [Zavarzinia compransoris]TDP47158.1 uncharacterized protein DUF937 [Zavarzinia compransoris]
MDIIQTGIQLLKQYFGDKVDVDAIGGALRGLLGGEGGQVDLAGLVGRFTSQSGLQGLVGSVLGGGEAGGSFDPSKILAVFGADKVSGFAQQLGVSTDEAAGGLSAVIPQLLGKVTGGEDGGLLGSFKKIF